VSAKVDIGGVGQMLLLAMSFAAMKMAGFIDWSWWWVLFPIWLPLGIVLFCLIFALCVAGVAYLLKIHAQKRGTG